CSAWDNSLSSLLF
nr:immunoglobulin light chain junction region [Macaca mulatta]